MVSSDPLETSLEFAQDDEFEFAMASDTELVAIRAWGVRHRGKDLAVPAVFVVDRSGIVRYRRIGEDITDRAGLEKLLAAVEGI